MSDDRNNRSLQRAARDLSRAKGINYTEALRKLKETTFELVNPDESDLKAQIWRKKK